MKNLIAALSLVVLAGISVMAQKTADYQKNEFYVGYSNGQVDTGFDAATQSNGIGDRTTFHGFEAAGVHNFSRYFGLKADVSGTYNSTRFSFPVTTGTTTQTVSFDTKNSLYNVLGGVQVKDNSVDKKFKPFAHALAGIGHGRINVRNLVCTTTPNINCGEFVDQSSTGFAAAFGGGLDIKLNDKVDLRAFQVDYNPIKFEEGAGWTNNFRFGIGIVIK